MARLRYFPVLLLSAASFVSTVSAQNPQVARPAGSILDRIMTQAEPGSGAWTAEQIATMSRLRNEAMNDPYTYSKLTYLSDSIAPRPSGSVQAGAAVEWVAPLMRTLGATVTLAKTPRSS